jgi:predicted enzyme related to lactoylglutathione lyase
MVSLSFSVDVPNIADGIRFYVEAFGFTKIAEPYPGVVVLDCGNARMSLLEKRAGTKPSINATDARRYERHWTPVHLDIHVDDLQAALAQALAAGAIREQVFEHPQHGGAAFCSDPFGHGFYLIQSKPRPAAARDG